MRHKRKERRNRAQARVRRRTGVSVGGYRTVKNETVIPDLSVELCGVRLKNPILTASGTFGFGKEYAAFYDINALGGICTKGVTKERREGNPSPRIAETPAGILNSVGVQNPGVDGGIREDVPFLETLSTAGIANV
ncbi:MAG: hypothetical protein K2L51_03375, partial [Clostridiales bacterium]|nr:hypothetical protein [Clostridiales bacterium]